MKNKKIYIFIIVLISVTILLNSIITIKRIKNTSNDKNEMTEVIYPENNQKNNPDQNQLINSNIETSNATSENVIKEKPIIAEKEEEITIEKEVIAFSCPVPKKEYADMWLLNIGQDIGLPDETYTPKDLAPLEDLSVRPNICLVESVKTALAEMETAAGKDGLIIRATSAYRSYSYQKNILESAIKNGQGNASVAIAKPGYSEHQLGTAVDLSGSSIGFYSTVTNFDNTPEDLWLKENAYKYGFAISYPFGKEDITGYMYEPWHYRYIGIDNVKLMIEKEETINEFLTQ